MAELSMESLTTQYFDVLKEIGNIGAGNATTALATMLQCKVDMKVPQVRMMEFKDVGALLGGEEQELAGAYLSVEGDITGSILFLVQKEVALHLVSKLMGGMGGDEFGEMERSAFKEISNIVTGSYLNALSTMTNMCIYPSIPVSANFATFELLLIALLSGNITCTIPHILAMGSYRITPTQEPSPKVMMLSGLVQTFMSAMPTLISKANLQTGINPQRGFPVLLIFLHMTPCRES